MVDQLSSVKPMNNDIYATFEKCYKGFDKICGSLSVMDGAWIGIVVDHLSRLLVEYAEAED